MRRITASLAILAALSLLGSCATKPAAPEAESAPEPAAAAVPAPLPAPAPTAPKKPAVSVEASAIKAGSGGFWPSPESRKKSVSIDLLIGNAKYLRSWKVEIARADAGVAAGAAVWTRSGKGGEEPSAISWDGRLPDGKLAAEGRYVARLSASYTEAGLPELSLASKSFSLSLSPPEPILVVDPPRLEPVGGGVKAPLSFEIDGRASLAAIESWRLDVVGPDGKLFASFAGKWPAEGAPPAISWDGKSESGQLVQPGRRYQAVLSLLDEYGHGASTQGGVAVADLPYPSERSSVQAWSSGFSPNGDKVMDSMDFSLGFGQRASVRSWRLEIAHAERGIVRSFRGAAPELPSSLTWDGKASSGAAAPEGRYSATLYVDYGSDFSPAIAKSPSFILDVTPPVLRLSFSPELFSPGASGPEGSQPAGEDSVLSMRLEASSSLARVTDWSVEVIDPGERVFQRFGGSWSSPGASEAISWDGVGSDGALVDSAETYRLVARCRDEFGNSAQAEGDFETDILVIKEGDRYRVDVASIVFKGYTDDFNDVPAAQAAQNRLTLDRLAAKFAKFPGYRIRLVGHAVMINWDDPNLGKGEQERILVPLSKARAAAIAKALSARGIDAKRMSIEGVGASKQVVPDSDTVNRWKNRRVEFYLEK